MQARIVNFKITDSSLSQDKTITFDTGGKNIIEAYSLINSFSFNYTECKHQLHEVKLISSTRILSESSVTVFLDYNFFDKDSNDTFNGMVKVLLVTKEALLSP